MKTESKARLAVVVALTGIFLLVLMTAVNIEGDVNKDLIKYTDLRIRLEETNATFSIKYETKPLLDVFSFFFGTWHMSNYIHRLMYDFNDYEIKTIGKKNAEIKVKGMAVESGQYYLHYSKKLGSNVDTVVYIYPDGSETVVHDINKTLNTFYENKNYIPPEY